MKRHRMLAAAIAAGIAAASPVEALVDPTQPPQAESGPPGAAGAEPVSGRRLTSILLSSGRKLAVIDGQPYSLGDRIGEARIVRITETEVVLRTGKQDEVLRLLPAAVKTERRKPVPETRKGGGVR